MANARRSFLNTLWIFSCFFVRNCQPAFKFLRHWLLQKLFSCFSWPIKSLAWTLTRIWAFTPSKQYQTEDIKSDGGYGLVTIVRCCITWSVLFNESPKKLFCELHNIQFCQEKICWDVNIRNDWKQKTKQKRRYTISLYSNLYAFQSPFSPMFTADGRSVA